MLNGDSSDETFRLIPLARMCLEAGQGALEREFGTGHVDVFGGMAESLFCAVAGGLGALDVDFIALFEGLAQNDNPIVEDFRKAATDGVMVLLTVG